MKFIYRPPKLRLIGHSERILQYCSTGSGASGTKVGLYCGEGGSAVQSGTRADDMCSVGSSADVYPPMCRNGAGDSNTIPDTFECIVGVTPADNCFDGSSAH